MLDDEEVNSRVTLLNFRPLFMAMGHAACSELLMSHKLKQDATVALRAALAAGTLHELRDATSLHGAAACATLYQETCEAREWLEEARRAIALSLIRTGHRPQREPSRRAYTHQAAEEWAAAKRQTSKAV